MNLPELVLPAGSLRKMKYAIAYGADAVYAGVEGLSMRPDDSSFSLDQLAEGAAYTHNQDRKFYAAINCLMSEADLQPLADWLNESREIPLDAVIVGDLGALALVRKLRPELPVHISTQMSTANSAAAELLAGLGAKRIVLARECSLAEAKTISAAASAEIEIFVHGAMCVAVSGRCLLSAYLCGHSGSKGDCKHSCRWEWEVVERKRPDETLTLSETERGTIFLGSTDLCLIQHLPALVESGVSALKVEGRMKSEYYAAVVASVYRAALDSCADSARYNYEPAWKRELEAVSHRPFGEGFAFGYPKERPESIQATTGMTSTHDVVGYIEDSCDGACTVAVKNPFQKGESLEWFAPGGQSGDLVVESIQHQGVQAERARCATTVTSVFAGHQSLPPMAILRRKREA